MKKSSTLKQLTYFTQQEKQLRKELFQDEIQRPKASTVQSILISQSLLALEKLNQLGNVELVLN